MPDQPLAGLRVLVTREREASAEFAALLAGAGATPVICPAIEIAYRNPPGLDEALRGLARFDWLVLTSANAVRALAARFDALELDPEAALDGVAIGVVGAATGTALAQLGGRPEVVAQPAHAEELAERLAAAGVDGALVLFPASRIARPELAQRLRVAGAGVVQLSVYDTVAPRNLTVPDVSRIDVATFTSPSTVRNFIDAAGGEWFASIPVVCTGPTTADAARAAGIANPIVAGEASLDGLTAALAQFKRQREQVRSYGTG